jgi:hypothetical protein
MAATPGFFTGLFANSIHSDLTLLSAPDSAEPEMIPVYVDRSFFSRKDAKIAKVFI